MDGSRHSLYLSVLHAVANIETQSMPFATVSSSSSMHSQKEGIVQSLEQGDVSSLRLVGSVWVFSIMGLLVVGPIKYGAIAIGATGCLEGKA